MGSASGYVCRVIFIDVGGCWDCLGWLEVFSSSMVDSSTGLLFGILRAMLGF